MYKLTTCFRTFLENMNMSSSLPKIFETGINVFISNSQIITIKTYYEKSTIYNVAKDNR